MLLLALVAVPTYGKKKELRNVFYFEYGGSAILYSINYDRILFRVGERNFVGARLGFSWLPLNKQVLDLEHVFAVPVTLNYLYGKAPHFGEVGAGVALRMFSNPKVIVFDAFPSFSIGYRARAKGSGTVFRVDFTPLFYNGFVPWFGISMGRAF